jgi:tRNA-Thr(GGU) m(6)t(6)A37 methyltransferase TsaA
MEPSLNLKPIGYFKSSQKYTYDVAQQGVGSQNAGVIELTAGNNFEQALIGLEKCSHIWIIFGFHQNSHWKPMVQPPRHPYKMGVFATRAPYRPNPIGISVVNLEKINGRTLEILNHDLIDGTPVYDIKPYLPYADSFPNARVDWEQDLVEYELNFSEKILKELNFLALEGVTEIKAFIKTQLSYEPLNHLKKRVSIFKTEEQNQEDRSYLLAYRTYLLAYRTWRILFQVVDEKVLLLEIMSGYTQEELAAGSEDPYLDKEIHRKFLLFKK